MLIIHEVMGRNCGWLTAATAVKYREWLVQQEFIGFGHDLDQWDIHAVYVPELDFDIKAEAERLKAVMDKNRCVNIFLSEGAGVETIIQEMISRGEQPQRDAFGHVKLDQINPGQWFANQFSGLVGAEKTRVWKSGYFARSAAANADDLRLIKSCTDYAVDCALRGESGLIGHDEENGNRLRAIEFPRIKGGKPFDTQTPWFSDLLTAIGQPKGDPVTVSH
jgi:pyrophosphate--fructose-6-phosphate 1-phosphotransferase